MKDVYSEPDFGSIIVNGTDGSGDLVEVKESYYSGKLRNLQITKTQGMNATGFLDAAEKALREIHRLMVNKICHDSITVKFDIDRDTMDINRIHITHIPNKEKLN